MNVVKASLSRPLALGHGLAILARGLVVGACLVLSACGGSADAPPPPEGGPPACVGASITTQPADTSVSAGQSASFTVVAAGTGPLSYQWQRNETDIEGATAATYTLSTTPLDSGAVFRAVVTNCAGSVTSNGATLTVTTSGPVLTISPQPADTSVTSGASATFTVGGTCSSGTLDVQWQRNAGAQGAFVDIAGATATTYSFMTVLADSGAQLRAVLDCGGQSSTPSSAATLTVTPPGSVTLSLLPLTGLRAQAQIPSMTAIDQEPGGTFAIATGNRIKRLSVDLLTIDLVAGSQGSGTTDGAAATAQFNQPRGLTHDAAGNLYVADTSSHTIRRIASDGTVSTIAGSPGVSGSTDGTGNAARFQRPWGIALGPDGDLYVADTDNNLIRRVTTAGVVTTYAGSTSGYLDGAPLTAQFRSPIGIAVAANGDVLVGDASNDRVRRIVRSGNVAGSVETLAGNGTFSTTNNPDGVGTAAVISDPLDLYVRGNTLTLRDDVGLIRQIDLTSKAVTTLTGSRTLGAGYADGTSVTARIRDSAGGITGAPNGAFITVDDVAVRLISAAGDVTTLAANAANGQTDTGVGTLPQQPFALAINRFAALAVDPSGRVVVADNGTEQVRRIDATGAVTLAAGLTGGFEGVTDGKGSAAQFVDLGISLASSPTGVTFVGDEYVVRRIAADNTVTTLAGSTTAFGGVDGNAATARFNRIFGLAVGPNGDVFAADAGNNAVRRIDAAGNVTTYAGVMGQAASVDGPIATARFLGPRGVAFGPDGSLYVADGGRVRKISPDGSTVSTINAAGGLVQTITVDAADTLYYYDQAGLSMIPAGAATSTLLIPATTGNNVLGTSPRLFSVQSMAMLGAKQIVLISASQLLVATLP